MYSESEVADMFTTIVVGVDGLQGGRDALALAQRISDLAGGELVAVHVHPYEPFPMRGLRTDVEALAHEEAQALLEGAARRGRGARPGPSPPPRRPPDEACTASPTGSRPT